MINEIGIFVTTYPWASAAISLVFGAVLGANLNHRYSLFRDRRREFNIVADPVRIELRRQSRKVHPMDIIPPGFDAIEDQLWLFRRAGFRRAVEAYREARQQHHLRDASYGSVDGYSRTDHIEAAIQNLIRRMTRR